MPFTHDVPGNRSEDKRAGNGSDFYDDYGVTLWIIAVILQLVTVVLICVDIAIR